MCTVCHVAGHTKTTCKNEPCTNISKYASGKRLHLDRDLLALQRALNNRVPEWGVEDDWQLPQILEQFQNSQLKALMPHKE